MTSIDTGTNSQPQQSSDPAVTPPLRIGLIAPQFPPSIGGMQELAAGLAAGLAQQDDVCVYTLPENGIVNAPFRQKRILTRKSLDANLAALAAEDAAVDVWCAMDAGLVPLASSLSRPFFAYFHGNDFLTPGYGFRRDWSELLAGKPLLWRYARRARRAERQRRMRRSLSSVREIFTNSRSTAELIRRTFPALPPAVTVIPPGVADVFFQETEPHASGVVRILTISRLTKLARRKNIDGVLHAVHDLHNTSPELALTYTIVGDGDDRPRLEQLAATLGIQPLVTFRGHVSREDLLLELRRADLFVLAPRATPYDVEGFGIVYLEASASGVPVIGSVEGGATDAIETGTNGILISSSASAAIAAGIREFALERHRFSSERVRAFARRFRWPEVAARLRGRIATHVEPFLSGHLRQTDL